MHARMVSAGALAAVVASVAILSLEAPHTSAVARAATCGGAPVTISFHDHGVGTLIEGTNRADVIQGGPDREIIDGGGGGDVICGGGGDDELYGGAEADRLFGEDDNDTFFPGTGEDAIDGGPNRPVTRRSAGDLVSYLNAALDDPCDTPAEQDFEDDCCDELNAFLNIDENFPNVPPHAQCADGRDLFIGVESLRGMRDTFNFLEGDSGPNVLIDGDHGSALQGHEGNDLLFGLAGGDVLDGDEGDDFLDGGGHGEGGDEVENGGEGTDTCINGNPNFTSDCEIDTACGAGKNEETCDRPKEVAFRFELDGFPDKPDEKKLPDDLAGVELRTSGAKLKASFPGTLVSAGAIFMTNTYLTRGLQTEEKSVKLKPAGFGAYYADGDRRGVSYSAYVESSDDPNCPAGPENGVRIFFQGGKGSAALTMTPSEQVRCLAPEVAWEGRTGARGAFKVAKIGRPK